MLRPTLYQRDWLSNYFDEFEKKLFNDFGLTKPSFSTDVIDTGDYYLLKAELPGFAKEDIQIEMKDGYLNIHATHQSDEENHDEDGRYLRRERRFGSVSRNFYVGNIDASEIKAEYQNGVLELSVPKEAEAVPNSHRIEIK